MGDAKAIAALMTCTRHIVFTYQYSMVTPLQFYFLVMGLLEEQNWTETKCFWEFNCYLLATEATTVAFLQKVYK